MSSYFDYFCENVERKWNLTEGSIKGTCNSMCPNDETILREKERLVHVLEVHGSSRTLVKCFSRSAADANMAKPQLLRPYPVLRNTVAYLLLEVTKRVDVPSSVIYDFVNDRLRAVRQDMTIQRLPPAECASLLEPMIRFYVLYGYKLSALPLKDYDPVLNKKYLLECLKWYLYCCDAIQETQRQIDSLSSIMDNMDLNKDRVQNVIELTCDRVLMESLYILCNLDDIHPLMRYIGLLKGLKRSPKLRLAYEIAIANLQGNYVRVCRLLEQLCVLPYCAVCTYLPNIQRQALQTMSVAYNSKRLTIPTSTIATWLNFSDARTAALACAHYGLEVEGDAVRFDKTRFSIDQHLHINEVKEIHTRFNVRINDIFTYS